MLILSVLVAISFACKATFPTPPPSPAPVTALVIHFPKVGVRMVAGYREVNDPQFEAYTIDADQAYVPVTDRAVWSTSDSRVAQMAPTRPGFVIQLSAGHVDLVATYGGLVGRLPLAIRGGSAFPYLEARPGSQFPSVFVVDGPGGSGTRQVAHDAVTWRSSDERIATVERSGLVRRRAPGNVRIIATVGELSDWFWISVPPRDH